MALAFPEPSPGPRFRARCCGSVLQSLYRYHVVRCDCGRCVVDGGADAPRVACHNGDASEWLEPAAAG